jgi:hypothetical protein
MRRRTTLKISDVQVSKEPRILANQSEVDAVETRLWFKFPDDYREYVTELGEGVLGGSLVRIYPPWRIEKELAQWRQRINKYWFWDQGREILPKDRALECIIIGETVNGDELIFHPTRPSLLFVLPRDSEEVFVAGDSLLAAIDWMCNSGELVEPFSERNFEPFDSRTMFLEHGKGDEKVADPEGESVNEIAELGKRWMKRHLVRKLTQEDLKKYCGQDKKANLLYEAFVMKGEDPFEPGYLAVYRIEDKATWRELGILSWHMNEDSRGYQYWPNK